MKHVNDEITIMWIVVAPRRGAWVETTRTGKIKLSYIVAPRRGAWVETLAFLGRLGRPEVAPRRGAWVETSTSWSV